MSQSPAAALWPSPHSSGAKNVGWPRNSSNVLTGWQYSAGTGRTVLGVSRASSGRQLPQRLTMPRRPERVRSAHWQVSMQLPSATWS